MKAWLFPKGTRSSALFDAAQLVPERSFHARGAAFATRDAADVGAVHRELASDTRVQPVIKAVSPQR
jgi:hypothetical protein